MPGFPGAVPAAAPERPECTAVPPQVLAPVSLATPCAPHGGLAPHPGAMERAEPLQRSKRYAASSRSVCPPSLQTVEGAPVSVPADDNRAVPAAHCCHMHPRGRDAASPVLASR